jgi:hypothetical protein
VQSGKVSQTPALQMSGQQSPENVHPRSHWQVASGSKMPHLPTHDEPETHCPSDAHTSPREHSPQRPEHPSDPHSRPVQSGTHEQAGSVSQTPASQRSGQQSPAP